jgi:hypothetical protein
MVLMSSENKDNSLKGIVLTSLFAAAGAAGGYLMMFVPNVEILTLFMFISGYVLGISKGVTSAIIASVLYFGLNPQGGMFPPLLIAQILGLSVAPIAGSFYFKTVKKISPSQFNRHLLIAVSAVTVTVLFDLLTNVAFPISTGMGFKGIISTLILGIPFSLMHISSNLLIFLFVTPPLLKLVDTNVNYH